MNRRTFLCGLTLGAVAAPLATEAQPVGKVWRIGFLALSTPEATAPVLKALNEGLRDLSYVEGRNIVSEVRYAEGRLERLPDLAADLVRLQVDVIIVFTNAPIAAAKRATATIPIVMVLGEDPVGAGFIASLARPGGNITGLSFEASTETAGKLLELLKEIVPKASRVAILRQVGAGTVREFAAIEAVAGRLGMKLEFVEVRSPDDFDRAFAAMGAWRADAFYIYGGPLTWMRRQQIADLALKNPHRGRSWCSSPSTATR